MCETHTVHHLCGHIKIKTVVQCADMVDKLMAFKLQTTCLHRLCDDVSDNIHIFPNVCDKCEQTGVIGGVLDQQPGLKLDILRDWKRHSTLGQTQGTSETRDELVQELDVETTSPPASENTTVPSSPKSVATSTTSNEASPDLASIKTRIALLRTRTEVLLARLRPPKAFHPA